MIEFHLVCYVMLKYDGLICEWLCLHTCLYIIYDPLCLHTYVLYVGRYVLPNQSILISMVKYDMPQVNTCLHPELSFHVLHVVQEGPCGCRGGWEACLHPAAR